LEKNGKPVFTVKFLTVIKKKVKVSAVKVNVSHTSDSTLIEFTQDTMDTLAFLKAAPILPLDEITSSVDLVNESLLSKTGGTYYRLWRRD